MDVVHIIWLDSEAKNDWTPIDEVGDELDQTHSVGLLVKEAESFLLLALSFDPDTESINCFKKIPRSAILKVRKLCRLNLKT